MTDPASPTNKPFPPPPPGGPPAVGGVAARAAAFSKGTALPPPPPPGGRPPPPKVSATPLPAVPGSAPVATAAPVVPASAVNVALAASLLDDDDDDDDFDGKVGELSEGDIDSDTDKKGPATVNGVAVPQLSDHDDDDNIDMNEVAKQLAPGTLPVDLSEMGEGERAIFGGDDDEPAEFAEFAEPEGKTGHITQWADQLGPSAGGKRGGGHQRTGSALNKCADVRCMSFAARGNYCMRHVWQDGRTPKPNEPPGKLGAVFDELIHSEDKYNKHLWSALHFFQDRLRLLVKIDKPLIATPEIDRIFLNLYELYRVSEDLLSDLRELKSHRKLMTHTGSVFLHYTPLFEVYRKYCAGQAAAIQTLHSQKDKSQPFRQFIELNERAENASLDTLLSYPTGALQRYMSTIEEIKSALPKDSPMTPDLEGAYRRIADLSSAVDASTGITSAHKQVQLIQDSFERDAKFVEFANPNRTFHRSGVLKKKYNKTVKHAAGTKVYTFFLFNDVLILGAALARTKPVRYKMKTFVQLYESTVKATPGPKRDNNEFEIKVGKKKPFTCLATSEKERDDWVGWIDARIADTRKNPPPNSPYRAGSDGAGSDAGGAGGDFSLDGKSSSGASGAGGAGVAKGPKLTAAQLAASGGDDFDFSGGPSKNFKPIGGVGSGGGAAASETTDVKSNAEPSSPKPSGGGGGSGISEAAARMGLVEDIDTDPEAGMLFEADMFEEVNSKPKSLYVVI